MMCVDILVAEIPAWLRQYVETPLGGELDTKMQVN